MRPKKSFELHQFRTEEFSSAGESLLYLTVSVCLSVGRSVGRSVGLSVGRSKKLKIGIMSISWLKLNYLSTVIPKTIINELLAGTIPQKNHLPELFQQKNKENISGAFNYSRRLLHTHACYSFNRFSQPMLK